MAKIRNITNDTIELRHAGVTLGVAEPDALLEIPDSIAHDLTFPESIWAVVTEPDTKRSK